MLRNLGRNTPLLLALISVLVAFGTLAAELLLDVGVIFIFPTIGVLVITVSLTMVVALRGRLYLGTREPFALRKIDEVKAKEKQKREGNRKYLSRLSSSMGDQPLISFIAKTLENSVKEEIPKALMFLNPTVYSKFYSALFIITLAALMPSGMILFLFLRNPIALILVLSPFLLVLLPVMEVKVKISNRKSDTGNEFPFFMVYAATIQAAGLSLFSALDRLAEWRILPKIKREALVVKRDYMFFSHNPLAAIENVAKQHPDENVKTIFLGYTSVLRSGGDLVVYLNSKVKDGLSSVIEKWRRYAESASTLGEISLSVFLMFPSLLIAMSVAFASDYSVVMMQLYGYMILPLLGGFMIFGIHFSQPKFYDAYDMKRALAIAVIAAAGFGAATFFLIQPVSYWLAGTLLVFSVITGAEYLREQSEVSKIEKALPNFLRDITEMMKIGYDISQALINLSKQRQYNKVFDRLLKRVSEHLEMNMPLRRVAEMMAVRSWLCRYTFFILSEIVDTGGGTPEVLENLTGFVNSVVLEKSKAKSTTRTYSFLGYATPAFLSAVMVFMANMLFPSLGSMSFGSTPIAVMPNAATLALIAETGMMVVVLTAFVVGLLIAKIVDMSVYATYHSAISLVICFVSFIFIR